MFRLAVEVGAEDVGSFNEWYVRRYADRPVVELVDEWWQACRQSGRELRSRGRDGTVDSTVGPYSSWLQSFHFAGEYATHADDIGVHVEESQAEPRAVWRARFGAFVLGELGRPVRVEPSGHLRLHVSTEAGDTDLSTQDFVEATQGRLAPGAGLTPAVAALLNTAP